MKMIIWNKFGKVEFTQMPNGLCVEIDAHNTVRFTFRGKPEVVFTAKCMSREEAKAVAEKHIPAFALRYTHAAALPLSVLYIILSCRL